MNNQNAHSNVPGVAAPLLGVPASGSAVPALRNRTTPFGMPSIVRGYREETRDALITFVHAEVAAEERKHRHTHADYIDKRVEGGKAITGLQFNEIDGDGLFVYRFVKNVSKFKANDLLVLNAGQPRGNDVLDKGHIVWLHSIDTQKKIVRLSVDGDVLPPMKGSCTLDEGCRDYNSDRLTQAIHYAYQSDDIVELLHGQKSMPPATVHPVLSQAVKNNVRYRHLTERQKQALDSDAATILIQGPPGSGKTHLLALMIEQAVGRGQKVLVTAPTHKAINNLLLAVAMVLPKDRPIIKIDCRPMSSSQKARIREAKVTDALVETLDEPCVVGATIHQAFKLHMSPGTLLFDLAVIDEAGQMPIAHAMSPLLSAERHIIAGDHKQLAPVFVDAKSHHPQLRLSIFERLYLYYSDAVITLDVTFRMNDDLNEFPSRAFYNGVLKASDQCAGNRLLLPHIAKNNRVAAVVNHDKSITFLELAHRGFSRKCEHEAGWVADIVHGLVANQNVAPRDIAVISAHNLQCGSIKQFIDDRMSKHFDRSITGDGADSLIVDSVECLQGQEREVIIVSLGASDAGYSLKNQDFLYNPNRLNVSITRGRKRLFVVGSKYFFPHLSGVIIDTSLMQIWQQYYGYLVQKAHYLNEVNLS